MSSCPVSCCAYSQGKGQDHSLVILSAIPKQDVVIKSSLIHPRISSQVLHLHERVLLAVSHPFQNIFHATDPSGLHLLPTDGLCGCSRETEIRDASILHGRPWGGSGLLPVSQGTSQGTRCQSGESPRTLSIALPCHPTHSSKTIRPSLTVSEVGGGQEGGSIETKPNHDPTHSGRME